MKKKTSDYRNLSHRATPLLNQRAPRLLHRHDMILLEARTMAKQADNDSNEETNDLAGSDVIRTNELQAWFVSEHLGDSPVLHADGAAKYRGTMPMHCSHLNQIRVVTPSGDGCKECLEMGDILGASSPLS